jgi:hypothetical protein
MEKTLCANEIEKKGHMIVDKYLSEIFFAESKRVSERWGKKIGEAPHEYYRTDPVELSVDNERVELILHAGGKGDYFAILERVIGVHEENIPIQFSISPRSFEDSDGKKPTSEKTLSALNLLAYIDEELSKKSVEKYQKVEV